MFGGAEGVADTLCEALNQQPGGLACVGAVNPGFGSVAEMSADPVLERINASEADLLTVFMCSKACHLRRRHSGPAPHERPAHR